MTAWDFTERKFLSLKEAHRHKKASELLREILHHPSPSLFSVYRKMENWLSLSPIELSDPEAISHRFHFHLSCSKISWKEHSLLHIKQQDKPSNTPFLPIHIFLCSLRSAFNVGSIFRTVEAFRLGTIHCSPSTPTPNNPKVQKAAMGTSDQVPFQTFAELEGLPRPWIALETASPSTPLSSFPFPPTCTLILGNEEFGVPKEILLQCDFIVEIPLCGSKNSLNVASALAIAASTIRTQYPPSQLNIFL